MPLRRGESESRLRTGGHCSGRDARCDVRMAARLGVRGSEGSVEQRSLLLGRLPAIHPANLAPELRSWFALGVVKILRTWRVGPIARRSLILSGDGDWPAWETRIAELPVWQRPTSALFAIPEVRRMEAAGAELSGASASLSSLSGGLLPDHSVPAFVAGVAGSEPRNKTKHNPMTASSIPPAAICGGIVDQNRTDALPVKRCSLAIAGRTILLNRRRTRWCRVLRDGGGDRVAALSTADESVRSSRFPSTVLLRLRCQYVVGKRRAFAVRLEIRCCHRCRSAGWSDGSTCRRGAMRVVRSRLSVDGDFPEVFMELPLAFKR